MGHSYFRKISFSIFFALVLTKGFSQPFVDILNTSFQSLGTTYKDSSNIKNRTSNYYLNITIPVKIDSQNTVIARFYGENLYSTTKVDTSVLSFNLSSALLP